MYPTGKNISGWMSFPRHKMSPVQSKIFSAMNHPVQNLVKLKPLEIPLDVRSLTVCFPTWAWSSLTSYTDITQTLKPVLVVSHYHSLLLEPGHHLQATLTLHRLQTTANCLRQSLTPTWAWPSLTSYTDITQTLKPVLVVPYNHSLPRWSCG